ncbi:MAG: diguanylate cyclase, partial [Oscillospiraceae bacterium]
TVKIEQITKAAGGGVFQCHVDKYLTVVFANDGFYKFIGISREDFLTFHGNRLLEIIQPKDIDNLFEGIQKRISCEQSFSEDICVRAEENQLKWMWINAEVVKNANGELSLYCIFSDVTQRRLEQEELKTVQQRYLFVLNHTEDMIFEWDYKTKEMYQMGGQDIRFNYRPTIKVFPEDLLVEGGNIHPDDAQIFLDNYHSYDKGAKSAYAEYRLRSKSGIYCWCSTSSVGVFENGELTKVMGKIANINGQKIQFLEMSRRAMCDPLTELYNRKATESLVEQYIETNPHMAAMLVIDLDNFKLVNDTLGHLYGDGLLNDVAVGIKNAFRDTDIVGRIGGDEFAVFLTDIQNIDTVHRVSKNILAQFERIFSDVKMPKSLTGSVGISLYPQDATSYTALVEKADIALYHAKNTGKNKYVFYSEKILSTDASLRKDGRARARRTPNDSQKREDLYKLALEKANLTVWIYDVKNARIQRVLCSSSVDVGQFSTENFPHDLVARGYIHADSVKPFLELHQKLSQGEQEVFAEICAVNPKNGELVWSLISYSLMTDECGNPDIAIGTAKNITNQKKAQIEYKHEMDMRMVLETDIICTSITNLTQNEVEQFRYVERPQVTGNIVERYEDIQAAELVNIPNPNDRKKYSFYTREMLLELFSQGKTPIWLNFRLVDRDGRLIWVSRSVSMLKDAQSGNIFAYVVIRDIDIKKRQELSLSSRVVVDELTGAYEQETARELINNAIKEDNDNGVPFALINFNVDRYGEIMSLDDEASAQAVMAELADLVRYKFSRQLLGRFFSNQIFVLVQNISDRDDVINTVNEIRDGVRLNARFVRYNALVTLSAGVVFSTGATRDFDSTYGYAAIALDTAKKTGYNKCIVYSNDMKSLALAKHGAQEKATQTALRCALALAAPKDTAQKLTEVLGAIGEYYAATKTFLVESAPSDGSPNCIYNWSPAGVKVETGTEQWDFSQNFPYIYSCLMQNPIGTFNDTEMLKFAYPMDYQSLKSAGVSSLFVAIIKSAGESLGYLFVINSKRNAMDKDFFTTVCKFLTSELEKRYLHEKQKFLSHHDADTGLLNRNRYIEYAENIKEESLISMGVVSADINGLKKINNLRGHDYGDLAVKSIAVAISQVFSGYSCYRFAGDEFLVVCENISKTAFIEKVKE